MSLSRISWVLWIGGTIEIVLSWTHAVTPQVGWIGWGVALAGTVLSLLGRKTCCAPAPEAAKPSSVVSDLDRLVQLRDRGDITEEQYLRQRNALLGGSAGGKSPGA
jgi:hypothetical protein